MEACYINVHSVNINTMITAICNIKFDRESLNILYGYKRDIDNQALLDSTKCYLAESNLFCTEYSVAEKRCIENISIEY